MDTGCSLYEGWVRHRRWKPVENTFRYPLYLSYLNMEEVEKEKATPSHSRRMRRWMRGYRREDHFGDPEILVSDCVRALVSEKLGFRPEGAICLLTHLRQAGYVMNPVSFFYCWNTEANCLDAIVAEVHNTPWGETCCYVLDTRNQYNLSRHTFAKTFHVSPFMGMKQEYRWSFSSPAERLVVQMENIEAGERIFDATLSLRKQPATPIRLLFTPWRYLFMTYRVIVLIYWQAFRLWLKHCPYHPHPRKQALQEKRNEP